MTIQTIACAIIHAVIFTSCTILPKHDPSQQIKIENTTGNHWVYGKTFVKEVTTDNNPELGGSPFLRFETYEVIELKKGDIIERVTAKMEGDKLILTSIMTSSKFTFEILYNHTLMDEFGEKWISDMVSQDNKNIPFTMAKNYFVHNTVTKIDNPKMETAEKFSEIFGMATTMGITGKPTEIDFSKQFVIAVILPETDLSTTIYPISLLKNTKNEIILHYKSVVGEKQSFTTRPNLILIVDKIENGRIILHEIN